MTIPGGYILQPRCIDDSDIMHEPPVVREVWFYLLRRVNHKDNGKFERGTNFFQFKDIQEALHWCVGYRKETYSKPQLTKAMRRLRERNMIETTKATRGIWVSVLNYNYYQNPKNYEGNTEGSAKETRKQRREHHYKQEVKNVKNKTNKNGIPDFVDKELWKAFREHRAKLRKPMTDHAEKIIFNKLQKAKDKGHDPNDMIETAIERGWQSVFEPQAKSKPKASYPI